MATAYSSRDDFATLLQEQDTEGLTAVLRVSESTARPLGAPDFIDGLERLLGRRLARGRPGRPPEQPPDHAQQAL